MKPAVKIQPNVGPINRTFIGAGLLAATAYSFWPQGQTDWMFLIVPASCALSAVGLSVKAMVRLARDYKLRKDLASSRRSTTNHGSARKATKAELEKAGILNAGGDLIGLDDEGHAIWRPYHLPFGLIEMSPGTGKTSMLVLGSIINRAMNGYSLWINDPKCELAVMLAPALRKLGFEVWCSNPTGQHLDVVGDVELGSYQALVDAVYQTGAARKNAVRIAADYAATHYPPDSDEHNPYFGFGSRRIMALLMLSQAVINPAKCTPTAVYNLLTDPKAFMERLRYVNEDLEGLDPLDPLVAFLKAEARNLLDRGARNDENLGAFLEGASQRMLPYNPAGHLGDYGTRATHNIKSLREKQIILFMMTPLSHMRDFAAHNALFNHNLIAACKATPDGRPVHIVAEEALAYKMPELTGDLETMRQLGVTADFYVQSYAGLERAYGKEAAQAIESYCDVRVYAGINSPVRAKFISDALSETTLRKESYGYGAEMTAMSVSSDEIARPLQKPNEIMARPKNRAWVFISGVNPVDVRLIHYGNVHPWSEWVGKSPITGTRLHGERLLTINYSKRGPANA
jgi:type IV secretion system protein VirD4